MSRLLGTILKDSFQCLPGLLNEDVGLVCHKWGEVVARNKSTLPQKNLYRVSLAARSEVGHYDDAASTVFTAEIETDYTEGQNPPVKTVEISVNSFDLMCNMLVPLLRNSYVATFEVDFEELTAAMCARLQGITTGMSVNWLDFGITKCLAPAPAFHALLSSFRRVHDLSIASMRVTSACVSVGLLHACLANGTTEISLPIAQPADNRTHYGLNLRELIEYVFRQCATVGFVYVGARRISGCEDAGNELSKIRGMTEEYTATLTVSGIGLTDKQKRKLCDETDDDSEPACKKRRASQSTVAYVCKAGPSKDVCIMRREFPKRALKRSMTNILS